ncbi:Ig-like domain-containing protein [uncultured Methanobrevibacter sp.]|uniref:Ig-like domain-containing protein n=1 Tax=uncultured Methanobrevibacter sp. TaxID=253161 RepID=UPI0025F86BD7|nr:Ig-like domain-containing protein [uncultured Methanobrevibacter sp.]
MNKKITLLLLSIFIVAVAVGAAVAAEAKTNTEIKMLSEKTLKNGDAIEFQLKDAQGKAIASQKVNISFEANGKLENYSVITDKDGKFYLVLKNEELGDHKVIANYPGNDKYNPSKLEETIKIVNGESDAQKTDANSTANTVRYDNTTTNNTTGGDNQILYYDAQYNFYYNQWGIIVGGQNDGADAEEIATFYKQQEEKGSTNLE